MVFFTSYNQTTNAIPPHYINTAPRLIFPKTIDQAIAIVFSNPSVNMISFISYAELLQSNIFGRIVPSAKPMPSPICIIFMSESMPMPSGLAASGDDLGSGSGTFWNCCCRMYCAVRSSACVGAMKSSGVPQGEKGDAVRNMGDSVAKSV